MKGGSTSTPSPTQRRWLPTLDDLKKVVSFKTFYFILVIALVGIIFIILEAVLFRGESDSPWKGILSALGITFLTSSTVSIIYEIFVKLDVVDFMAERISSALPSAIKIESELSQVGFVVFLENRVSVDFRTLCRDARQYVKIIGFSANDIISPSNLVMITQRIKSETDFFVRILIINPWSIIAQRRGEAMAYSNDKDFIRRTWGVFLSLSGAVESIRAEGVGSDRFDVRLYDTIPSLSMIIDYEQALVTPIVITKTGGQSPTFIVRRTNQADNAYLTYQNHFDVVWAQAQSIEMLTLEQAYSSTLKQETNRASALPTELNDWIRINSR